MSRNLGRLALLLAAFAGFACSGGGSGSGHQPTSSVNGSVAAAKVSGARIQIYRIETDYSLTLLQSTTTDVGGGYQFSTTSAGPFLVVAGGGTYVDEASAASLSLGPIPGLSSLSTPRPRTLSAILGRSTSGGTRVLSLSPLTTFAAARAAHLAASDFNLLEEDEVERVHLDLAREFGLVQGGAPVDPRGLVPLDPSTAQDLVAFDAAPTSPSAILGAILAGLSQSASNSSLTDPLDLVDVLASDFKDGVFDGLDNGALIGGSAVPRDEGTTALAKGTLDFLGSSRNRTRATSATLRDLLIELGSRRFGLPSETNSPPSALPLSDVSVQAGTVVTLTLEAVSPGVSENFQSVSVVASSSDLSVVPSVAVTQPGPFDLRTLTFTPIAQGTATITVTLSDMNATTTETTALTFQVEALGLPPVAQGQSIALLEDAAAVPVTLAATDPQGRPLTYTIVTLPTQGTLTGTPPNLAYTASPNANGPDSFTFLASSPLLSSAPATVSLAITAVNDRPSFTRGPHQHVPPTAGAQSVPGWARWISRGTANESAQVVTFDLTNTSPGLFAVQPSIDAAGTLSYTPAAAVAGVASLTVVLRDDGGVANGGADRTAAQPFQITVRPANAPPTLTIGTAARTLATSGQELLFTVSASDPDGDPLDLRLHNPPPGCLFPNLVDSAGPHVRTFRWTPPGYFLGTWSLLFSTSDGATTTTRTIVLQASSSHEGLLVGDVTGDGQLDVVAGGSRAAVGGVAEAGVVFVWAGTATPTGTPSATLQRPSPSPQDMLGSGGIQLSDVTGDGVLDVIVTSTGIDTSVVNAGAVLIWAGGPGLTGTPAPTATLQRPLPIAEDKLGGRGDRGGVGLEDLTGDGITDLVVGGFELDTSVVDAGAVLVWAGGASLIGVPPPLATLQRGAPVFNDRLGLAGGIFSNRGNSFVFGDVSGDGVLDLLVNGSQLSTPTALAGAVLVWVGGPTLTGTPPPTATLTNPTPFPGDQLGFCGGGEGMQLADLTGDGLLDVIVVGSLVDRPDPSNPFREIQNAGVLLVWRGGPGLTGVAPPLATLRRPVSFASDLLGQTGLSQGVLSADVSGDGILDLIVASESSTTTQMNAGEVLVWLGGVTLSGTPLPQAVLRDSSPQGLDRMGGGNYASNLLVGDVSGDGLPDIVVTARRGLNPSPQGSVALVWHGGATLSGTPQAAATLRDPVPNRNSAFSAGRSQASFLVDLSGDGVLDLVFVSGFSDTAVPRTGEVFYWEGSPFLLGNPPPTATLVGPSILSEAWMGVSLGGQSTVFADVTGDQVIDIVVVSERADTSVVDAGAAFVWAGGPTLSGTPAPTATLRHPSPSVGDFLGKITTPSGGQGVLVADITGDGTSDVLLFGSEIDTTAIDAGACLIWAGGAGMTGVPLPLAILQRGTPSASDFLGFSRSGPGAVLEDTTGDGVLDLLLPGSLIDTAVADAGAVLLWRGGGVLTSAPTATLADPSPTLNDQLTRIY